MSVKPVTPANQVFLVMGLEKNSDAAQNGYVIYAGVIAKDQSARSGKPVSNEKKSPSAETQRIGTGAPLRTRVHPWNPLRWYLPTMRAPAWPWSIVFFSADPLCILTSVSKTHWSNLGDGRSTFNTPRFL